MRSSADLVIFLDAPRSSCLPRACKRNLPYLFRSRPGLPPDCPELIIFPKLVEIIVRFPERVGRKLLAEAETAEHYRVIRSSLEHLREQLRAGLIEAEELWRKRKQL